jgi:hypothetical protein
MARYEPLASANIDTASSGDTQIVAAQGAGKKIRVHSYRLVGDNAATANTAKWTDGPSGATKETVPLLANTGIVAAVPRPDYLFELSANTDLTLNLSAAQRARGGVTYSVERTTGTLE